MAPKGKSKSKKSGAKAKSPSKGPGLKAASKAGDRGRLLPDKKLIISLCKEMTMTKRRSSELSGGLGQSLKDAKERGVNVPMLKLAHKMVDKAADDPIGAGINWEDFNFYLETLEFDKAIAKSMFKAEEVRSGKKPASGKNGHDKPQTEKPIKGEAVAGAPPSAAEERTEDTPVH
jgi:hypothetical protein